MFHKAIKLDFGEGTVLELTFQDGKVKRYDMAVLLEKYPQFTVLKITLRGNFYDIERLQGKENAGS